MTNKKTKKTETSQSEHDKLIDVIAGLVLIALSLLGAFQFGILGFHINNIFRVLFGQYPMVYYVLLILGACYMIFRSKHFKLGWRILLGLILLYLAFVLTLSATMFENPTGLASISHFFSLISGIYNDPSTWAYGGMLGALIYGFTSYLVDRGGVYIVIALLVAIGLILLLSPSQLAKMKASFLAMIETIKKPFRRKEKTEKEPVKKELAIEEVEAIQRQATKSQIGQISVDDKYLEKPKEKKTREVSGKAPIERTADFKAYTLPSVQLLDKRSSQLYSKRNQQAADEKGKRLIEVMKRFGIEAQLIETHIGPAVTKFEIKPDSNVKISKITSIQDNLMMELAVKTLRIESPIPGKIAVGIEIPNEEMIPVLMRDLVTTAHDFFNNENIQVALGKNLFGNPITISLNKMPHLLIAGATGSGKSVCMNAIITSLLLTKTPNELRMILIDPKKVEFTQYDNIPHLLRGVVSDPGMASKVLLKVVEEMEERYDAFAQEGVRNIAAYNEKIKHDPSKTRMYWIVVIIDELADLMVVAGREVESSIQRITQLARAAGIHLIVATQRPSVDVITGIIKANIPSRIAFAVSSAVDSRTILDSIGAEKLLGYGDMLYLPMGEPSPIRLQGVYVSDDEVERITAKAKERVAPDYPDRFLILDEADGEAGGFTDFEEPLYNEAVSFVIQEQKASTSLLQRRFKIGYNRAANLVDELERNHIIGPALGSKPRQVLIKDSQDLEDID